MPACDRSVESQMAASISFFSMLYVLLSTKTPGTHISWAQTPVSKEILG